MTVTFNGAHLARDPGAGNKKTKNEGCHGQGCRLLAAASLAVVAGCAGGDVVLDKPGAGYVQDIAARAAPMDWAKAKVVAVTLSEYKFSPASVDFRVNVPYRLVLQNTGTRDHAFVSKGFFKAIAAHKLVSADAVVSEPYLASIGVPAGAQKELSFVPVRKGTYDLQCTVFLHQTFGMEGTITIR